MERPQIKHIAIAVPDGQREKLAEYYKTVFRMEERSAVLTVASIFPTVTSVWP